MIPDDLDSEHGGELQERSRQQYKVTFTFSLDEGHKWGDVSPDLAHYDPDEGHSMTYTLPAASRRLAEEYAELRLSQDTRSINRNHLTVFTEVECEDPESTIGDDFREDLLDAMKFYIERGLTNDEIIETLEAALEEMKE